MQWLSLCQGDVKMNNMLVLLVGCLFIAGGCVQMDGQNKTSVLAVAPTVVFEKSDSSYLLACINELQELKEKNFERYYREAESRLEEGDDLDALRYICLSLHSKADYKQLRKGEKLFRQFIDEHPDALDDMQGLLVLFNRLDQAMVNRSADRKQLLNERDRLAAEVEALQLQVKRDQGRIKELQGQINQLKNIENIIKNREHKS